MKNFIPAVFLSLLIASQAVNAKPTIPPNWKKIESKDPMTDQVTKFYGVFSNESNNSGFFIGCNGAGFLGFSIQYPKRSGIPSAKSEVRVRIDSQEPFTEEWFVGWVNGQTTILEPYAFLSKVKGKSKLAVDIFAAAQNTFNIKGIEAVVADMESTACKFENKTDAK
jgi:hypothetical protein